MGRIKQEVRLEHLSRFPAEEAQLEPLLNGFEVSWARERKAYNTSLSVYILTPENHLAETFGLNTQIALFIPHYASFQPRLFQAIYQLLNEDPLNGRVDRNTFLLLCGNEADKKIVFDYITEHARNWIPILLTSEDLAEAKRARWGIRHPLASQIFTRDLFNQELPLKTDIDFFGRESLLFDFRDAISKSQNRAIFGLRKTGKTSVLFKAMRSLSEKDQIALYYDCKKPRIRRLTYPDFLSLICNDISEKLGISSQFKNLEPDERIERIAQHIGKKRRVCLIFDEIEYVSFLAKLDPHWHIDFINLWQTLWSLQSEFRNFSFFISGVNPTVVEIDKISGIQNPLFGIVSYQYLTGLNLSELRRMLHILGRRMGLEFTESATLALHRKYGGHPLLTRKACSFIHTAVQIEGTERPVSISSEFISMHEDILDENMEFYFKHVLTELEDFYPDEYEMLKMAVAGQRLDFSEFATDASLRRHLESYGLVSIDPKTNIPTFMIDCLRSYLERETARKEGRQYRIRLTTGDERASWLKARCHQIVKEFRALNVAIEDAMVTSYSRMDTFFIRKILLMSDRAIQSLLSKHSSTFAISRSLRKLIELRRIAENETISFPI
ncbi:AAA domain-containing protein [Bradyrhizobium sp. NFR13]|uniref:AAA family ATPase n=1 Tax=Bradyrhizobium sp. NFR13 TaxID=1566285 RepID=UPI0008E6E19D|nr:AAA family ATPase [Bradyrhizobium sp. NFR13]SFL62484.1 AAA domain-containing protein [Bradyrhizobium sp. NFR13]